MLAKRQGCDFSLICDDVQFDVHTGFLLGGADLIEEHIHPGGVCLSTLSNDNAS